MIKYFFNTLIACLLLAFFPPMLNAQCINWQTPGDTLSTQDISTNQNEFWNDPAFNDPFNPAVHNLAEAEFPAITVSSTCSPAVTYSYVLLMDLDGDGIRESAMTSTNSQPDGLLLTNNANIPGYQGTETAEFDNRPVAAGDKYKLVLQASEQAGITTLAFKWTTDNDPGTFADAMFPYGVHELILTASNGAETFTKTYFVNISDGIPPTIICLNGLAINLMPTGMVEIWTTDILQYAEDNFTAGTNLVYSVRRFNEGTGFPVNLDGSPVENVEFNCSDIGEVYVELWAKDQYGNADYCLVSVFVEDKFFFCQPELEFTYTNASTCADISYLWANTVGLVNPLQYNWSNGSTTNYLSNFSNGTYAVTVTDAQNETLTGSYTVTDEPENCAIISGWLAKDDNGNCLPEPGEATLANMTIQFDDGQGNILFTTTDANGNYAKRLNAGNYTVSVLLDNELWVQCAALPPVTLVTGQETIQHIALTPNYNCPAISVSLSTPYLESCTNNLYYVSYCNEGTDIATNAYVDIQFDDYATVVNSAVAYTDLGNHNYRFEIGTVQIGDCGQFILTTFLSCQSISEQTHCATATAYPIGDCIPANVQWSGASIQLTAECDADSLRFRITNTGVGNMTESVEYIVIEDLVMVHTGNIPPLNAGGFMIVSVPYNGKTWRVEVDQVAYHPGHSKPALSIESCNGPVFQTGLVNVFAQNEEDPWIDIACTENSNVFIANSKFGYPTGYGPEHYIDLGTPLMYDIHFLNTSNDTVQTVIIRDTLSPWLDPATVFPGSSNFDYQFEFEGTGPNMKFTFNNVNLPPVNPQSPYLSIGFVSFYVQQKTNVPLETDILGRAGIYFDNQAPLFTNQVQHRVGAAYIEKQISGTTDTEMPDLQLQVMPNPVTDLLVLQLKKGTVPAQAIVQITDALGRNIAWLRTADQQSFRMNCAHWPKGIYTASLWHNGRITGRYPVVKM